MIWRSIHVKRRISTTRTKKKSLGKSSVWKGLALKIPRLYDLHPLTSPLKWFFFSFDIALVDMDLAWNAYGKYMYASWNIGFLRYLILSLKQINKGHKYKICFWKKKLPEMADHFGVVVDWNSADDSRFSVFSHFSGDWPVSGRDIIGVSNSPADPAIHITIVLVMGWPTVGLVS